MLVGNSRGEGVGEAASQGSVVVSPKSLKSLGEGEREGVLEAFLVLHKLTISFSVKSVSEAIAEHTPVSI